MTRLRLAAPCRAAIRALLTESERRYGTAGRLRYKALIDAALQEIAKNPLRPAARRTEIDDHVLLTYHLTLARRRVPEPPGRVQDPPHAIVYEMADDGVVDVYGLIHERMQPDAALRRLRRSVYRNRRP